MSRVMDREWFRTLGRFILQGVVGAVILLGLVIGLSGPSQEERRQTAQNVEVLIAEFREQAELNRELSCRAILGNPENPAREDPRILELCAEIGVRP